MEERILYTVIVLLGLHCLVKCQDPTVLITQTDPVAQAGTSRVMAIRDKDLTMDCYVENLLDTASVRWQRINLDAFGQEITKPISQDMAMDDNIHYSIEKPTQFTWRLRVRGIQVSDEGVYMCFVQVTLTTRVFDTRTVQVQFAPYMDPAQTSSDMTMVYLDDLDLTCNASGRPDPLIEWSRLGGSLLPIGQEKFKGMVLKLTKLQPQDRGKYRCTAINRVATVIHDVSLGLMFPPVVTPIRTVIYQAIGYRAELQCAVEANPYPKDEEVSWSKGASSFSQTSNRYEVKLLYGAFNRLQYELIIYSVRQDDYGSYACRITNQYGTVVGQMTLQQASTPQPSVKLGRVIPGNERSDSGAAAQGATLVLTVLTVIFVFILG